MSAPWVQERKSEALEQSAHWHGEKVSQTIEIFGKVIDGQLVPEDAAATLAAVYTAEMKRSSSDDSQVWFLWDILCKAAQTWAGEPKTRERLVKLVQGLAKQPDVLDKNGEPMRSKSGFNGTYWKGLPGFHLALREIGRGKSSTLCRNHRLQKHSG